MNLEFMNVKSALNLRANPPLQHHVIFNEDRTYEKQDILDLAKY